MKFVFRIARPAVAMIMCASPLAWAGQVRSDLSDKCIDIQEAGQSLDTQARVFTCANGAHRQDLAFNPLTQQITAHGGQTCLAVAGNGRNGDAIVASTCSSRSLNQKWQLVDRQIVGINNRCIDIQYMNRNDGARLILHDCHRGSNQQWTANLSTDSTAPAQSSDACSVKDLRKSAVQGAKSYSADGSRFVINQEDDKGVAQIYVGAVSSSPLTCITCTQQPGGPRPDRYKMQPRWHPSGKWLFVAVERDNYSTPPLLGQARWFVEGQLQNGLWTNMYAVSLDGTQWHRMTDFKSNVPGTADGYTGPAFTPDGKRAVWSQIVDGNVLVYTFGRWELILADFDDQGGVPRFANHRNVTPPGMHWNEAGTFSPDNVSLLLSGSVDKNAQGMDIYKLNIQTKELMNLTNSPTVWDEHGVFSPDGEKIIFMSAHPYRADSGASKVLSIKTEFMLMNKDGSGLTQLTRFKEPGHPESSDGIAAVGEWNHDGRSVTLRQLFFPKYQYWDLLFEGACGRQAR